MSMGWYTVRISTTTTFATSALSNRTPTRPAETLRDLASGRQADHAYVDRAASSGGGVDCGDCDVEPPLLLVENVDSQLVDG